MWAGGNGQGGGNGNEGGNANGSGCGDVTDSGGQGGRP
jgi:hypothetical protein